MKQMYKLGMIESNSARKQQGLESQSVADMCMAGNQHTCENDLFRFKQLDVSTIVKHGKNYMVYSNDKPATQVYRLNK